MNVLDQATTLARSSPEQVRRLGRQIGAAPQALTAALGDTDPGPVQWASSHAEGAYRSRVTRAASAVDAQVGQLADGGSAVVRYAVALERGRRAARGGVLQADWGRRVVETFRPFASTSGPALAWTLRGLDAHRTGVGVAAAAVSGVAAAAAELHRTLAALQPAPGAGHG